MIETQTNTFCSCCYSKYTLDDIFCKNCGYPLQGTKHQQDSFISDRQIREIELEESNKKIKSATNSLYWIAGVLAFWGIIFFAMNQDSGNDGFVIFITNIILSISFLALGAWSKTKPAPALISGLSLFVIIQILNAVVSPISILSGIIFKVIIIGYLIKGIKGVLEADKLKKELNVD
ncbi:hypothetical protein [Pedobacter punctiformis]|uniref:Zinc ribbon domain-containing protein n=1 Tax=Pedobacter punctiformis TaxID=3004097 RepID=A0ABT4L7G2_9SPHI|nr:hypothetical protein [Pedobacter sp. HCMS5-2]MCZ4243859.1 hypothetical protein [Pedobacter sp. HCMS5-2]